MLKKKHTSHKVYRIVRRLLVHIFARLLLEIILRWFAFLEYLDTNRFSFDQVGRHKRITPLYHQTYTSALPLLINLNIGRINKVFASHVQVIKAQSLILLQFKSLIYP
ncbi:hypothetical protein A3SI_16110 [Nitritalea halalkaliphila LW7]|uniref:Uncharacterized protein n=1 Tax=Nitritalea halalkaliphila LW7 TaxID=1189621 RepID=I5BXU7_9BACT|nr:hypothetical protein A3SI_16110 [Nitritalea halalkaliphila LW7]